MEKPTGTISFNENKKEAVSPSPPKTTAEKPKGRELQIKPTVKQYEAWKALRDPAISEIYLGGGAGGGKSWFGCESRLVNAIAYPGYKTFIARNELTRLMASTYVTWTKVCAHHKIPQGFWNLNGKYNYIEFKNGSRIDLLDVAYKPSDPLYERFGSTEYTDGWFEEAGEIPFMAIDVLRSRTGRHLNKEFNLRPTSLYTYNPNKGWIYRIYKQWKDNSLPADIKFIQSLYKDNPHTREIYGKQLERIEDKSQRARLMLGSFEYDDDPSTLIEYDAILDLFTNTLPASQSSAAERYLTIDVARHGVDKTVFYKWEGLTIVGVRIYHKQGIDVTAQKSRNFAAMEAIPFSHCLADEDGIGGGVVDINKGFKGFIANSVALENAITYTKENFASLKAQCSYKLASLVNSHGIAIKVKPSDFISEVPGLTYETWKQALIEELEQIRSKDADKDGKRKVISKDEVKETLGRSPDFADTMMMRMWFELSRTSSGQLARTFIPNHQSSLPQSAVARARGVHKTVFNFLRPKPRQ